VCGVGFGVGFDTARPISAPAPNGIKVSRRQKINAGARYALWFFRTVAITNRPTGVKRRLESIEIVIADCRSFHIPATQPNAGRRG